MLRMCIAFVLVLGSANTLWAADPDLAGNMEEMGEVFKKIRRGVSKGDMGEKIQTECAKLSQLIYVAVPMADGAQELTALERITFKKLMAEALAYGYTLEESVLQQKLNSAKENIKSINSKRKEAHDLFKEEN